MENVYFKGQPVHLEWNLIEKGSSAPDFTAVNQEFNEIKLSDYTSDIIVLTSFLSLDTSTCDLQVKTFNKEALKFTSGITVLGISMDLPFAQKRFCEMNGIKNVDVVSDYRYRSFGENYGLLVKELKLLARAVLIVRNRIVEYVNVNRELSEPPDYDDALNALARLSGGPKR
jgi:thioredoxin-dependent peroxiredoxin